MYKHLSQALGCFLCSALPLDLKPGPVAACQEPDIQTKGPEAKTQRSGDFLWMRTSREATTNLVNYTARSHLSWAEILSPPKGTAWSKSARPALPLIRTEDVQHTLDSATALLAKGLLQTVSQDKRKLIWLLGMPVKQSKCGQTQMSSPEYRREQKHSCSAWAFLRPYCTLRQKSFTSKSGVLHFCDLQRTKASALSSFYLTFSHGINKSVLITKKVFKGNPFLLWISKTLTYLNGTM